MKRLIEKKAFTIVEVIVSIAIFAAIALPLFSVFVQAFKTDRKSNDVLNANYISQDYIEKLDTLTYEQALTELPDKLSAGGYYLSAKIKPYGTTKSLFSQECGYLQIVTYSDGSMLCVMPDGQWHKYSSVPSSVSLSVSNKVYSFTGGYTSLSGNSGFSYCAMIINVMKMPEGTAMTVNAGANCKAVIYCKDVNANSITLNGDGKKYKNMIKGETSLIYVSTAVYSNSADNKAAAVSDSYINIKNW